MCPRALMPTGDRHDSTPRGACRRQAGRLAMVAVAGLLVTTAILTTPASAAVPTFSRVQGLLTSSGGGPAADGTYDMSFALFPTSKALAAVWSEGPGKVVVTGGLFDDA